MGSGFSRKKKEAKLMEQQFSAMQEKLKSTEVTGEAGNGLVSITLTGDHEMKKIKIKPECVDPDDIEGLEDLVKVAYTNATKQVSEQSSQGMPNIPGMGF